MHPPFSVKISSTLVYTMYCSAASRLCRIIQRPFLHFQTEGLESKYLTFLLLYHQLCFVAARDSRFSMIARFYFHRSIFNLQIWMCQLQDRTWCCTKFVPTERVSKGIFLCWRYFILKTSAPWALSVFR